VYDIRGKEIHTVVNDRLEAGTYIRSFDGSGLASGVYFYRLFTDGSPAGIGKMVLLK